MKDVLRRRPERKFKLEELKPGGRVFEAIATDLQIYEDNMLRLEGCVRPLIFSGERRLPREFLNTAFINWRGLRENLLRANQPGYRFNHCKYCITQEQIGILAKKILPLDTEQVPEELRSVLNGHSALELDATAVMQSYLPTQIAAWFSCSRKAYQLSSEDVCAFREQDFSGREWRDFRFPFGAFAVEFKEPLEITSVTPNQKSIYNGMRLRGFLVSKPSRVDVEFDEDEILVRLLLEKEDGTLLQPEISNKDRKSLKAKVREAKDLKTLLSLAASFAGAMNKRVSDDDITEIGGTSLTLYFRGDEPVVANDFTPLGNEVRKIIAGMCMFTTAKIKNLNLGDQSSRTPGVANMNGFVSDVAEMFNVNEISYFRNNPHEFEQKPGGGTVRPHARSGHWRRDWRKPDEEIWVTDTVVRRDLLPRDTLIPGTAVIFRPDVTRRKIEKAK